jgi:uridine kinase
MKKIIGLVGEIGSGKGTVATIINDRLPNKKIVRLKFSDVLSDILNILHLEKSRDNLQKLAIYIDDQFGDGTFSNAVKQRALTIDADIVFLDGVRWPADEQLIRDAGGILVYVTAHQKLRFDRIRGRGEKEGEQNTTWEQFLEQDQKKNETFIPDIGSRADVTIVNESTLEHLTKEVEEKLLPLL